VRARRRISPAARARRALLLDTALALALALLFLQLAAGFGVVAAVCLPLLILGIAWIGVERLVARVRLRRRRQTRV
jgi:hypothetical protein